MIETVQPLFSNHFNLTVEIPLKAIVRGHSYAVVPDLLAESQGGRVEALAAGDGEPLRLHRPLRPSRAAPEPWRLSEARARGPRSLGSRPASASAGGDDRSERRRDWGGHSVAAWLWKSPARCGVCHCRGARRRRSDRAVYGRHGLSEMDEGAVVAYADRVLDGAVPHRDFLTFYGPGNLWIVAGAFELFGSNVVTERAVGVLYRLVIVLALFALGRVLGGLVGAVLTGGLSAMFMAKEMVWANAIYGAIAFALLGLALAVSGARCSSRACRDLWFLAAGAASGVAVLVRFDIAPGVLIAALPLLAFVPWRSRIMFGTGFVGLAGLYVPYLAIVGPDRVERLVDDLRASGPGRSLPLPELTGYPGTLLVAGVLTAGASSSSSASLSRSAIVAALGARVLMSVGLFSVALLPWALSRADRFHIRPFAFVSLSVLPAALLFVATSLGVSRRGHVVIAAALSVLVVLGTAEHGRARSCKRLAESRRRLSRVLPKRRRSGSPCRRARRPAGEARRFTFRRSPGSPAHELRSDLHVLPAPAASSGLVLHGDEPTDRQSEGIGSRRRHPQSGLADPDEHVGRMERAERLLEVRAVGAERGRPEVVLPSLRVRASTGSTNDVIGARDALCARHRLERPGRLRDGRDPRPARLGGARARQQHAAGLLRPGRRHDREPRAPARETHSASSTTSSTSAIGSASAGSSTRFGRA